MRYFNIRSCILVAVVFAVVGCSTTSGVIVNPAARHVEYTSVYLVTHGENSADMDANLQREFLRHGYSVTAGAGGEIAAKSQLLVRYADEWRWDLAMYIRRLDVMIYDAKTNALLADGSWKNSTFHGFYGSEKVCTNVVNSTLAKMAAP